MISLVNTAKTLTTERDQYKGQYEELTGYIAATGATPEQYDQALNYLKLVNSPNIADRKACLAFMQQEIKALAISLGEAVPGVDLLADYPDLQQQVADGGISQQHAEELAAARSRSAHVQTVTERTQQQQVAYQRAVQAGAKELNDLEAELRAADPQFEARRAQVVAKLKPEMGRIPPAKWASTFQREYIKLATAQAAAPVAAPAAKPAIPARQPLRGSNPAGGAAPKAGSLAEAINLGIEQATRR